MASALSTFVAIAMLHSLVHEAAPVAVKRGQRLPTSTQSSKSNSGGVGPLKWSAMLANAAQVRQVPKKKIELSSCRVER
ncbi:hypothetical protein HS088_TW01G00858 [Tripterygium wilfordii]|uniref:Secreted protein n=1 Tax=Tripterygium wilfordii TaxID=458696 RepID=A0A7J7E2S4_TRIWF|nr:hypothetical protein HS088_TW01G00858 [Tripterygium wilfordii]